MDTWLGKGESDVNLENIHLIWFFFNKNEFGKGNQNKPGKPL